MHRHIATSLRSSTSTCALVRKKSKEGNNLCNRASRYSPNVNYMVHMIKAHFGGSLPKIETQMCFSESHIEFYSEDGGAKKTYAIRGN